MGINVAAYRYAHTLVGGAFAGVGGATFTLAITPQWVDGLTGGAGWIAIALVIFAFWRPDLCLVGAYFFGAFSGAAVHAPGARHLHGPAGALPGAAVRDDDRRARARLVGGAGGASARRLRSACRTCARSAERRLAAPDQVMASARARSTVRTPAPARRPASDDLVGVWRVRARTSVRSAARGPVRPREQRVDEPATLDAAANINDIDSSRAR